MHATCIPGTPDHVSSDLLGINYLNTFMMNFQLK